ncbi:MAG: DUF2975 domain-containing protein [Propionibacterium sp.]|nr:DUF2975 domain-containing protein [Propionibacterium sp.]
MQKFTILALRGGIVVLFAGVLFGQVLILPIAADEAVREFPEVAAFRWPYVIAAALALACVQVVLVATWWLLTRVQRREIFSARASRGVAWMVGAGVVAAALTLAVMLHLQFVIQAGGPALLGLMGALAGSVVFVLLMLVMRSLLGTATTMHEELLEVV